MMQSSLERTKNDKLSLEKDLRANQTTEAAQDARDADPEHTGRPATTREPSASP